MQDWQHMRRDLILYFITYFFLFSFLMRVFFSVGLCIENEFYFSRFCPGSKVMFHVHIPNSISIRGTSTVENHDQTNISIT